MDEDDNNDASYKWINKYEEFCSSDDLSLDELRKMINDASQDDLDNEYKHKQPIQLLKLQSLHKSNFLHRVCMNENVTLEIMAYLLDLCPSAINTMKNLPDVEAAYPLHMACCNKECPNEVIQLLLGKIKERKYWLLSKQLKGMCYISNDWGDTGLDCNYHGGTPLHFYLSRTSNVDLGIVERLAVHSEALLYTDEESKCTPIHILMHNKSIGDMFDVVNYLIETSPSSLLAKDQYDQTPLLVACRNGSMSAKTIELLLRICPDSTRQPNNCGWLPIHCLCRKDDELQMDDEVATDILQLLLEAHPDSVSETDDDSVLPIHYAAGNKSQAFCKILVDAYPESLRRGDGYGSLPFHCACYNGRPDTAEYLLKLSPDSLQIRTDSGYLPIHCAAISTGRKNAPEIIKFLVLQDPECLSKPVVSDDEGNDYMQGNGALPLHLGCNNINQFRDMTQLLYDLYPEAILVRNEREQLPIDVIRQRLDSSENLYRDEHKQEMQYLIPFLQTQMDYATKAQDRNAMETPEPNGLLPLHNAIRSGAPLGSIKLLVKGYPGAINKPDGSGMRPLDFACQFGAIGVVKYLAHLVAPGRMNACDVNKNYLASCLSWR